MWSYIYSTTGTNYLTPENTEDYLKLNPEKRQLIHILTDIVDAISLGAVEDVKCTSFVVNQYLNSLK